MSIRSLERNDLSPEDVVFIRSKHLGVADAVGMLSVPPRRLRDRRRKGEKSRTRKGTWKKLLWVKQSYPDNYTDEETFLDHLQRNPRLQPYEFWPLVADSTVIVQQVCTMIMFICCFSGIIQDRVSPVTIVSLGTTGTVLGWVFWDIWVGQEEATNATTEVKHTSELSAASSSRDLNGLGLNILSGTTTPQPGRSRTPSVSGVARRSIMSEPASETKDYQTSTPSPTSYSYHPPYGVPASRFSPRNQQRLATAKSAILIYCALLGLSPILKSLTKSTASDSIWAMSFWLMCINVIFFDYGGGVGAIFPASLSTNAALMASTVLASRLPSTTHVFSLTLFSIEVFGLFPVFRRYLRHISWRGHLFLTWFLVMGAGAGVTLSVSGGGWKVAVFGVLLGSILTGLAMGTCSWWLINLQRLKNSIHGPWDPARPIISRRWD